MKLQKDPMALLSTKRFTLIAVLSVAVAVVMILVFIVQINPFTNDDAHVYYNYARNFAVGRPFAYDTRNIPSEGFTSLIYMLLLVPFELLHINMTFASAAINIAAVAGTVALAAWIVYHAGLLRRELAVLYGLLCPALITTDSNIIGMAGHGLETMLGPLSIMAAAACLSVACQPERGHRTRSWAVTGFYITTFLCYLVRPENMFFVLSMGGLLLLQGYEKRRETIVKGLVFAGLLAAYHLWKLVVFGDIFPTGFYRKVSAGAGSDYVASAIVSYSRHLLVLGATALLIGGGSVLRRRWQLLRQHWLWLLLGVSGVTLLFFTQTEPLIGNYYRFLVNPIVFGYVIGSLLLLWGLEWLLQVVGLQVAHRRMLVTGSVLVIGLVFGGSLLGVQQDPDVALTSRLDLYGRSVIQTERHHYLRIGRFLRERLPQHEDITLVFGDAGAIPYSFDSRFIDFNGLTEPAIARLFQLPDGPDKTQQFDDYVLGYQPDLIVLAYGGVDDAGIWHTRVNRNSPFWNPLPIKMYEAFKDYGIVYACSIRAYYDLHIGVWQVSPYAEDLIHAVRDYCDQSGYTLAGGLTVASEDAQVVFTLAP